MPKGKGEARGNERTCVCVGEVVREFYADGCDDDGVNGGLEKKKRKNCDAMCVILWSIFVLLYWVAIAGYSFLFQ